MNKKAIDALVGEIQWLAMNMEACVKIEPLNVTEYQNFKDALLKNMRALTALLEP